MKNKSFIIVLILFVAAFLRFYNLMWGAPYFFHPDEKNMAYAISNLQFPGHLNPRFFAYGQFPLYLAYFSARSIHVSFPQAIFWLRFWSALSSTFTVYLVYLITKTLFKNEKTALLSAIFASFLPGLIQSAHFGTTESLLTFFFMLLIYFSLKLLNTRYLIASAIVLGLSISIKVSALIFFPIPLLATFLSKIKLYKKFLFSFLIFTFSFLIFLLTSPFTILDFNNFKGAMNYESAVALGQTKVFYTKQFENTTPILFQMEKIFPYALGLPIFIFGVLGIGICLGQLVIRLIKNSDKEQSTKIAILLFSFLVYFLPNAFLFAKWTRFMAPIFPLFAIFAGYFIYKIKSRLFAWLLIMVSILPGIAFFSIYLKPDVRVTASEWIYQNIPSNSYILSETANVVDIPVNNRGTVISFNFYELDENPIRFQELINHLEKADYIFIPSRRIFANYLKLSDTYPIITRYYDLLFSGKLGFETVAEFSSLPDENAEETFTVFDHPVVRIYKKISRFSAVDYQKLLTN